MAPVNGLCAGIKYKHNKASISQHSSSESIMELANFR